MEPVDEVVAATLAEEKRKQRDAENERRAQDARDLLHTAVARCPGEHYRTVKVAPAEGPLDDMLDNQWVGGYRLAHVIERGGETFLILEHHFH